MGNTLVTIVDPHTGKQIAPTGALGRWQDPDGNSTLVRRKLFNVTASQTDAALVTAVPDYVIVVLAVFLKAGATATGATFNTKPSGAGTVISPLFANGANGETQLNTSPFGFWFASNPGEGLTLTTSAGSTTGGIILYAYIPSASVLLADGVSSLFGADGEVINL